MALGKTQCFSLRGSVLIRFFDFPIYYVRVRRFENTKSGHEKPKSVYLYIFRNILGGKWVYVHVLCAQRERNSL